MDEWGRGRYEETASELAPVSDVAIAALGLRGGESVLDIACGTGNAVLVALRAGARVTGLDASQRLLEVARERAPEARFVLGDVAELPFADGEFDAAASVFGVIFARDAERAAAELARVVRAGGRAALTTWPMRGPVFEAVRQMREAIARVRPPEGPTPLDWGDPQALDELLGPYGTLEVSECRLEHVDATPESMWASWERWHPMWLGARDLLEPAGAWDGVREAVIGALRDGGIGAGAASPYLLAVLHRG